MTTRIQERVEDPSVGPRGNGGGCGGPGGGPGGARVPAAGAAASAAPERVQRPTLRSSTTSPVTILSDGRPQGRPSAYRTGLRAGMSLLTAPPRKGEAAPRIETGDHYLVGTSLGHRDLGHQTPVSLLALGEVDSPHLGSNRVHDLHSQATLGDLGLVGQFESLTLF